MLGNWIRETSTTTGTGNLTLAGVSGYPGFNAVFGTSAFFHYAILDDATGQPIEIGIGHLSDSTTLVRDVPIATLVSGTYDNTVPSAVSLAAGTKRVICAPSAAALDVGVHEIASVGSGSIRRAIMPDHITGSGTNTWTKDRLYYVPIKIVTPHTLASLRFMNGGTAGSSGTNGVRIGLYASDKYGNPSAKLFESGNLASASFSELTYSFPANTVLPPAWYYAAIVHDYTSAPNIYASSTGTNWSSAMTPCGVDVTSGPGKVPFLYEALSGGWSSMPNTASATPSFGTIAGICPIPYLVIS